MLSALIRLFILMSVAGCKDSAKSKVNESRSTPFIIKIKSNGNNSDMYLHNVGDGKEVTLSPDIASASLWEYKAMESGSVYIMPMGKDSVLQITVPKDKNGNFPVFTLPMKNWVITAPIPFYVIQTDQNTYRIRQKNGEKTLCYDSGSDRVVGMNGLLCSSRTEFSIIFVDELTNGGKRVPASLRDSMIMPYDDILGDTYGNPALRFPIETPRGVVYQPVISPSDFGSVDPHFFPTTYAYF